MRSASTIFDIVACCSALRLYQASSRTSFKTPTVFRSSWTASLIAMNYPTRFRAGDPIEEDDYIWAIKRMRSEKEAQRMSFDIYRERSQGCFFDAASFDSGLRGRWT